MPSVLGAWTNPGTKDLVHQRHRYTACVVVGKTTVCRIFSCQRSDGDYVPKPLAGAPRGPFSPLRAAGARMCAPALHGKPANSQRLAPERSAFAEASLTRLTGLPAEARSPVTASEDWWRIPGSNRRPPGCKPGALPAELIPQTQSGLRPELLREPARPRSHHGACHDERQKSRCDFGSWFGEGREEGRSIRRSPSLIRHSATNTPLFLIGPPSPDSTPPPVYGAQPSSPGWPTSRSSLSGSDE